ncbi:hypothetical protein C8034_v003189 [Colletotrichum sidae]|uniref:Secreted protein n=1 Tax=Colletotrichum sidae TaxID=1347389 RepID=A0A4V6QFL9_9PEZI|nr:hypothetical protein C8034_v003189 [Colletotrichum sidae]
MQFSVLALASLAASAMAAPQAATGCRFVITDKGSPKALTSGCCPRGGSVKATIYNFQVTVFADKDCKFDQTTRDWTPVYKGTC